jgi:uncharacterized membrane protein
MNDTSELNESPGFHPLYQLLLATENASPECANRILCMAEKDHDLAHAIRRKASQADNIRGFLGMGFGFTIALLALGISFYAIQQNLPWTAAIIGGASTYGTIISVFVTGRHQ